MIAPCVSTGSHYNKGTSPGWGDRRKGQEDRPFQGLKKMRGMVPRLTPWASLISPLPGLQRKIDRLKVKPVMKKYERKRERQLD